MIEFHRLQQMMRPIWKNTNAGFPQKPAQVPIVKLPNADQLNEFAKFDLSGSSDTPNNYSEVSASDSASFRSSDETESESDFSNESPAAELTPRVMVDTTVFYDTSTNTIKEIEEKTKIISSDTAIAPQPGFNAKRFPKNP
jgi:hypothetical protein